MEWFSGPKVFKSVMDGLGEIYKTKILPLEERHRFRDFHSPPLHDADFDSKPMVLVIGQYSTGKTTFIRYLLEQNFPDMKIGPEPTTDRFMAVMHNEKECVIPGNAAVVDPQKHFCSLSTFGNDFLGRFQCSQINNSVLNSVTFIDTPGILSGEKQRVDRGYDFTKVVEWFAERADRIIILFDVHKLDISDELQRTIEAISGYEHKIRVVLNKADTVDDQQLMRVHGALMWSLGKVLNTPEVVRVYIGSFWDRPLQFDMNRSLFEREEQDLLADLQNLPSNAALYKLNNLIKRARLAKVHAYITSHLYQHIPYLYGKEGRKRELITNLPDIFLTLQSKHQLSAGDFPNLRHMQEQLDSYNFSQFCAVISKSVDAIDTILADEIPRLLQMVGTERDKACHSSIQGGVFVGFSDSGCSVGQEGVDGGRGGQGWVVEGEKPKYDQTFEELKPLSGKVSASVAKAGLVKVSKLPNSVLSKVWKLADVDCDGMLDAEEWALANHLIKIKLKGHDLPSELPEHLIPPSKRSEDVADRDDLVPQQKESGWFGFLKRSSQSASAL